jgi:plasmid maintenance system antidote protein VapI
MENHLEIIKGIHPGFILARELKKRHLRKKDFALSVNEFPQTLGAIANGKRNMNTALALKIEKSLGLEEGFLMILQVYYDIEQEKRKQHLSQPDVAKLRSVLFWDTEIEKIDWVKHKKAVIERVFERGNDIEKQEITTFYGKNTILEILNKNAV